MAGTGSEKKKQGLLPPRPDEDGIVEGSSNRRPADVWLPRSASGCGEALDLACTSGMRSDAIDRSRQDGGSVFASYEDKKRTHLDTDRICREAGFRFTPLIFESHGGGWSPLTRKVLDGIAKSQSAAWLIGSESPSLRIAQRISIALHRENARAVLRRLAPPSVAPAPGGWGGAAPDEVDL